MTDEEYRKWEESQAELRAERDRLKNDDDVIQLLKNIDKARSTIMDAIKDEDQEDCFIEAAIACPICEAGKLSFRYAGHYNGHMGAECSNCDIKWQE